MAPTGDDERAASAVDAAEGTDSTAGADAASDAKRGGQKRPSDNSADYTDLVSHLSEDDLALATTGASPETEDALAVDPDADLDADEVFPQSVASGDPTPSGVVLWTRVDPEVHNHDRLLAVQVAMDADFEDEIYRAVIDDREAVNAHDHTVKVDLDGVLAPDETYYYRFVHDGVPSRTGRCRTLPAPDASPDTLRLAVLTCQNYQNGYYPAYDYIADEDIDFIVHVGDFIYEAGGDEYTGLGSPDLPDRKLDLPSGRDRVHTLEDYRYLYRVYRSDRYLQRAMENHTLIPAWDDHEIVDDIYWDKETDAPSGEHPKGDDPEFMTGLLADAIHAWWEFMPSRIGYDPEADSLQERFTLWRDFRFGDLVDIIMTDERLFRDGPREGLAPLKHAVNPDREDPDRTMLGHEQREWFLDTVENADAKWTCWTDEVLTIPLKLGAGPLTVYPVQGGWDGYTRERRYITERIAEMDVENFVTLTGDMHSYVAGYKQTDYGGPLAGPAPKETRVGVEFMTPSICSLNVAEALGLTYSPLDRLTEPLLTKLVTWMNPHIAYFNSHRWGYSIVEFTREDCTYLAYSVDKNDPNPDADREVVVAYRVPDGDVELHDVTAEYRDG
jgi:alkaline phosphatase D